MIRIAGANPMSHARRRSDARRAFSLIEAVISIALVSIVLVAALSTVGATARTRSIQTAHQQRDVLARQLMAEILRAAYTDPEVAGSDAGREIDEPADDRTQWDDVDDYDGLSNQPPREPDGTLMSQFEAWTRAAAVQNVNPASPDEISAPGGTGLKRVTVTVTDPWGGQTTHASMKSRDGVNDAVPASSLSFTSWVGVELQVGSDASSRLSSGTALLNHPPPATMNLLSNPGFEDGTANWEAVGASLAPYNDQQRHGTTSLAVTARSNSSSGPIQNVTPHLESGRTYRFRVWARAHNAAASQLVPTMILQTSGGITYVDGDPVVVPDDWSEVSYDFTPVFAGALQKGYVCVRSSPGQAVTDFLLDDAWLFEVSP
ncbi:MAG: carbohydrate binding domain-containing protein [Planctomycetota bacterium]